MKKPSYTSVKMQMTSNTVGYMADIIIMCSVYVSGGGEGCGERRGDLFKERPSSPRKNFSSP